MKLAHAPDRSFQPGSFLQIKPEPIGPISRAVPDIEVIGITALGSLPKFRENARIISGEDPRDAVGGLLGAAAA